VNALVDNRRTGDEPRSNELGAGRLHLLAPLARRAAGRGTHRAERIQAERERHLVAGADAFFADYSMSQGLDAAALGLGDGTYPYTDFKNDVEAALIAHFGKESVTRGKKAFDVHANTYRIDADVVPCFEHRRYMGTAQSHWYIEPPGSELHPDSGGSIVNWPRQNYTNGVAKNDATGRRFKAVTRIMKRLRNEMLEEGNKVAKPIPSYLLECLVWNVPNDGFQHETLKADVRYAIAHLWNETRLDDTCKEWGEVNELKYLFSNRQAWTRPEVNTFLQAAWDYIGFQ
jgi:hypothetical protein